MSRHSLSELAFQTPCSSHGKIDATMKTTMAVPITVSSALSGLENRFSRPHFTGPRCDSGGSRGGSMSVR